jgi:cytochrome c551/c552
MGKFDQVDRQGLNAKQADDMIGLSAGQIYRERESILKNSYVKIVLAGGLVSILAACGNNEQQPKPAAVEASEPAISQSAPAINTQLAQNNADKVGTGTSNEIGMPSTALRNNCTACHAINKKVVGPSWMSVSSKYKGVDQYEYNGKMYPLVEGLMMKVSLGGSGQWGSMPMPAVDGKGIKQAEIKELVQFILGLSK